MKQSRNAQLYKNFAKFNNVNFEKQVDITSTK